jgi:Flp pilus assembly protein TadB
MTWPLNVVIAAAVGAAIIFALEASTGWLRVLIVAVALCVAVGRAIYVLRQNRRRGVEPIGQER